MLGPNIPLREALTVLAGHPLATGALLLAMFALAVLSAVIARRAEDVRDPR